MKHFIDPLQQVPLSKSSSKTEKEPQAASLSGTDSKSFKKTMKNVRKRLAHRPLSKASVIRTKNIHALKSSKRLYRIAELQLLVRQLRLKAMGSGDKDLINAQLSAAQDELFRLMAKYKS